MHYHPYNTIPAARKKEKKNQFIPYIIYIMLFFPPRPVWCWSNLINVFPHGGSVNILNKRRVGVVFAARMRMSKEPQEVH